MNQEETTGAMQSEVNRVTDALQTMIQAAIADELGPLRQKVDELEFALGRRVTELRDELEQSRVSIEQQGRDFASRIEGSSEELRESAERQSRELASRIESSEQRSTQAVERLEGEVKPQLGELNRQTAAAEQRQSESVGEHARRLDGVQSEWATGLESLRSEIEQRLDSAREAIERNICEKTDALQSEVDATADRAERTHGELEEHVAVAGKMAAMLESMTQIFSHREVPPLAATVLPINPATSPSRAVAANQGPAVTGVPASRIIQVAEPTPASQGRIPDFGSSNAEGVGCRKAVDDALEKMFSDEE
jgi:predicted phage gp36 major capsid-like protein